jgi:hypothetical protein
MAHYLLTALRMLRMTNQKIPGRTTIWKTESLQVAVFSALQSVGRKILLGMIQVLVKKLLLSLI